MTIIGRYLDIFPFQYTYTDSKDSDKTKWRQFSQWYGDNDGGNDNRNNENDFNKWKH